MLNRDLQDKTPVKQERDKIRYQYDEHYFLTDPDEFIQEFRASDPEWQLLEHPISLDEFEALPFVRSIFFHYGLEFTEQTKSILYTDSKGGAEVKINVPDYLGDDIIFHYQVTVIGHTYYVCIVNVKCFDVVDWTIGIVYLACKTRSSAVVVIANRTATTYSIATYL